MASRTSTDRDDSEQERAEATRASRTSPLRARDFQYTDATHESDARRSRHRADSRAYPPTSRGDRLRVRLRSSRSRHCVRCRAYTSGATRRARRRRALALPSGRLRRRPRREFAAPRPDGGSARATHSSQRTINERSVEAATSSSSCPRSISRARASAAPMIATQRLFSSRRGTFVHGASTSQ
jgi:hypothetical protein